MSAWLDFAKSKERMELEIDYSNLMEAYEHLVMICKDKDKQLSELTGKNVSDCVLFYVPREMEFSVHEMLKTMLQTTNENQA